LLLKGHATIAVRMSEESRSESKLAQFQSSVNSFLEDDKNPFAQVFAMVEKYSNGKIKRAYAFWGKFITRFLPV